MRLMTPVLFVLAAPLVQAQDAYRDMSTDQALEVYSGITAGWFINQNCKLLSTEQAAELKTSWETVLQKLKLTWNPELFPMVEDASKDVAADKPYKKCGREAKDAVLDAVKLAKEWAAEIAGQVSSSK